jgi:hypothetical protein
VDGASLENVCIVVGGVPHAPHGAAVIHPGDTSSMVELPPEIAGTKTAVYFELAMGDQRIPLITDEVFDFTPGAVCVLTITDQTIHLPLGGILDPGIVRPIVVECPPKCRTVELFGRGNVDDWNLDVIECVVTMC